MNDLAVMNRDSVQIAKDRLTDKKATKSKDELEFDTSNTSADSRQNRWNTDAQNSGVIEVDRKGSGKRKIQGFSQVI